MEQQIAEILKALAIQQKVLEQFTLALECQARSLDAMREWLSTVADRGISLESRVRMCEFRNTPFANA